MAELTSSQPPMRPSSQPPLWSSPLMGPPLPMRSSSRLPPCLPLPSQSPLPPLPPTSKRNGSHGPIQSPTTEHGWRSLAPLATGFRTYAPGPSSVGAKPFSFGPDYYARPPLPPPKVNIIMNKFVENKRKTEMVKGQTSAFPIPSRGTGVFHPLPMVQVKPSKNYNRGTRQKEGESSKPINIPGGNDGGLVKQEECHQLSPSDEYGLPKEWTY